MLSSAIPNYAKSVSSYLNSVFNGVALTADRNQINWDLLEITDEKQIKSLSQNDSFASFI